MTDIARKKALLWVALSAPATWLAWLVAQEISAPTSGLGADPGEALMHFLGNTALIVLLISFSVTPLRRTFKMTWLARCRRLVGLFAYFYVVLHVLAFFAFYLGFSISGLFDEVVERPYVTAGMAALVLLSAMAFTSTHGWQRSLGRNWRRLHMVIFPAVGIALLHLWWLTRDGYAEVALYTLWFLLLCVERFVRGRL